MYPISDSILLQLREAYVSLMDKDNRRETLLPVQHRKAVTEIGMEWGGRPEEEVTDSAKMTICLDWVLKEGWEFFRQEVGNV